MAENNFGIRNPYYLDSSTAIDRVRTGNVDGDEQKVVAPLAVAGAPSAPDSTTQAGTGFVPVITRAQPSPPAQSAQPTDPSQPPPASASEPVGSTGFTPIISTSVYRAPESAPPKPEEKPNEQGFFEGMYEALKGGTKQTVGRIGATVDVVSGDSQGVVDSARRSKEIEEGPGAQALKDLKKSFSQIEKAPDDASLAGEVLYYTKEVAGKAFDNLEGTGQFIVEQAPNAVVALGSAAALAKAGAIAGTAIMPGVGTAVGGFVGFLAGMFGGNALLEIGGKAQEKATDGKFTDAERSEALKEGSTKAGVITAVDTATLGASRWILGTGSRAVEKATIRALDQQGINAERAAINIKRAQDEAVAASRGLDSATAKANFERATIDAVAKEGLTAPPVVKAVQDAQKAAYAATTKLSSRLTRGGTVAGLETIGEGVGEYLGELAATGKSEVLDAVIESLAGAAQSSVEIVGTSKLTKPGTLTRATANLKAPTEKTTESTTEKVESDLNKALSATPDSLRIESINVEQTAQAEDGVTLMAALYASGDADRQAMIRQVAERSGVLTQLNRALTSPETISRGEQIASDDPAFASDFLKASESYVSTVPSPGKVKKPKAKPRTEEDVANETETLMNDERYLASLEEEIARIKAEQEAKRGQKSATQTTTQAADQSQSDVATPEAGQENVATLQVVSPTTTAQTGQASASEQSSTQEATEQTAESTSEQDVSQAQNVSQSETEAQSQDQNLISSQDQNVIQSQDQNVSQSADEGSTSTDTSSEPTAATEAKRVSKRIEQQRKSEQSDSSEQTTESVADTGATETSTQSVSESATTSASQQSDTTAESSTTEQRRQRVQKVKTDSLTLSVSDPGISTVVGSGDGSSRFERTVEKAENGDDAALDAAERFVSAANSRREAKRNLDNLRVESAQQGDKAPDLQERIDQANQAYAQASQSFLDASNALEAKAESKPLPKRFDERGQQLMPSEDLTIEQVKAERAAKFEAIKQKILAGQFFEAAQEWNEYSNTMARINSRIRLNMERVDYAKGVIAEEESSPDPDTALIGRLRERMKQIESELFALYKERTAAKDEFKKFLVDFVKDNPDSNLRMLVDKYVKANERKQVQPKSFLGKYSSISFYRNAINQMIQKAFGNKGEINLSDRPESLYEGLSVKQVSFLNALLDQTKLSDVKALYNEYKARREAAAANRVSSGLSKEGEAFQKKLDSIVNQLYEEDTYKNLISEYRARLEMIYRALNGKPEPGDIDFLGVAEGMTVESFDPSIAQDVKPSAKQVLLGMAKDLDRDIRDAMDARIESLATRYKLASDLIASRLYQAKAEAMDAGIPMQEINRVYDAAMRTFIVGVGYQTSERRRSVVVGNDKTRKGTVMESRYAPTLEQLFGNDVPAWAREVPEREIPQSVQDLIERTPLDAKTALDGLISDIQNGLISEQNAIKEIRLSIQDGDFSMQDVKEAFARAKRELPADFYGVFSNIAMNYSLEYWVKKNGGGYEAKDQWLTSYHTTKSRLGNDPAYQDALELTEVEQAEYDAWLKEVRETNSRRGGPALDETTDVSVLDKFLFSKYTLEELKNPDQLPAEDQAKLRRIGFDQLVREWHRDIEYAMRQYPNLRDSIISFDNNSDARVKGDDALSHAEWMQEVSLRVEQSIARSKSAEVRGLLGTLHEIGGITSEQYEEYFEALTVADANEAQAIADNAIALAKRMVGESSVSNIEADHVSTIMGLDSTKSVPIDQLNPDFLINQYETLAGRRSFRRDFNSEDQADTNRSENDDESEIDGNLLFSNENYSDDHGSDRLRQGAYSGVVSAANVQVWVADLVKDWSIHPNVQVFGSPRHLPEPLRSRVLSKLSNNMGAKGFFDGQTGNIYLFSDYLVSKDDTEFTLFHEAYGHLGMRGFLGKSFDAFLEGQYKTNLTVRTLADQKIEEGMGKLEAIEEVLADESTAQKAPTAVKAYIGKVINGLRKLGFNRIADWLGYVTNSELHYVLKASREWARNADYKVFDGAPDVIRLNETRLPYEMFSMRGERLAGYARYNPITNEWYVFSGMAGDIRNDYVSRVMENYEDVVAELNRLGKVERRMRSSYFIDDKIPPDFVRIPRITEVGPIKQFFNRAWQFTQNEFLPVFKIVDELAKMGRLGDFDIKTSLTLYERKTGVLVENFNKFYVTPIMDLVEKAGKLGASTEIINNFLVAQTAKERNAAVAKINPSNLTGSGMAERTRTKADGTVIPGYLDILEQVENSPYRDQLYEIGAMLDRLGDSKVDYEVSTGLISAVEGAKRKAAYRHYRNLSGINTGLDNDPTSDPSLNIGRRFNVKGKDKRAMGRGDIAPDVLARTLMAYESSLIRGQKNLVAQKVLALFETNYDPTFISINELSKVQKIGEDGFVQLVDDTNYIQRKDVMVAKVRGIPITMRFKQLGSNTVAEALHGMVYPPQAGPIMDTFSKFNRLVGQMLTTWNPFWIPVNFVRDVQTMWNNAMADGRLPLGAANQMMKSLPSAMHVTLYAAINDIHVKTKAGALAKKGLLNFVGIKKPNRQMYAAYLEARKEGALTSFINRKGLEEQVIEIDQAINGAKGIDKPLAKVRGLLKFMEIMTIPMEMAPRLATYKTVRDSRFGGMSKEQAAVFAGEITVNFNMRGSGKELRALYLFFNPAVQGTEKLLRLAYNNRVRFSVIAGAWAGFGMLMNMLGRAMSEEDDDGINKYDKLPVYKRGTSIVLGADQRGKSIPLPYGWNAFYAMGHFSYDSLFAGVPWSTSAKRIAATTFEAFSPIGTGITDAQSPSSAIWKTIAPTPMVPMVDWTLNENRFGAPIYMDDKFGGEGKPDSDRAFRSVSPLSQYVTTRLNRWTGGNKWSPGYLDMNPAFFDHLIGSYTPGLINETYKAASTAVRAAKGLDTGREKEPLFDRFSAYVPEMYDSATFRRVKGEMEGVIKQMKNLPDESPLKVELRKEYPNVESAWEAIKIVEANIRTQSALLNKLESQIETMRLSGTLTPEKEAHQIEAMNMVRKNLKVLYSRATKRFIQAGFRDQVVSGN